VPEDAPFTRHDITRFLESRKVETRVLFAGNILNQPGFRNINCRVVGDLPNTNRVMRGAFFVGVYPGLGQAQLDYMLDQFHQFFRRFL
jgi:CDP-6-deoxy-D-xylo-4-hexulose-3-dehydrase